MKRALGLVLLASVCASSQSLAAIYSQTVRPDLVQSATVANTRLSWHGLDFLFAQGQLALGAPIAGHVTMAVFAGLGTLQVQPPNPIEREQMLRFTRHAPLHITFTEAVFRFTDADAFTQALSPALRFAASPADHAAANALEDDSKLVNQGSPAVARILQALDAGPPNALLLAELRRSNGEWIEAEFDPSGSEPLEVSNEAAMPGSAAVTQQVWTEFAPADFTPPPAPPQLGPYDLHLTIADNRSLDMTAQFTLTAGAAAVHGLLLGLDAQLRASGASLADGERVDWLQAPGQSDSDWIYLRLPHSLAPGTSTVVSLQYAGKDVLQPTLTTSDWMSGPDWYPHTWPNAQGRAEFDLHFAVPSKYQVAASGERVAASVASGIAVSEWRTSAPSAAADFALGEDQESQTQLTLANGQKLTLVIAAPAHDNPEALAPLAGAKLNDLLNLMAAKFGPYPYPTATLTLAGTELYPPPAGMITFDPRAFLDQTAGADAPATSVAGQWWGAWITPATPHDAWLTLGMRALSTLLDQQEQGGPEAGLEAVRAWRHFLFTRNPFTGRTPEQTGPLWLGPERLDSRAESGLDLLVVKGGYGIYMLRQMMMNPRSSVPDAAFDAMMRDFTAVYGGQDVTTAEFQAMVEKHMTPAMDLDGNHKMDWFFQPLLYSTAVPRLQFQAQEAPPQEGVAQVTLTVENPGHWRGLLPVYLFQNSSTWLRGLMPITQAHNVLTVPVPFTPQYVAANYFLDMLVRVTQ